MPRGRFAEDMNPDDSKSTLVATLPYLWQCALDDIAEEEGTSRSQVVRAAVAEYLRSKGKMDSAGDVHTDRFDPYGWKVFV